MHDIQRKILDLAKNQNLDELGLRSIGRRIGVDHPQKVKFHIEQLQRKGLLEITPEGELRAVETETSGGLLNIPILGRANCGEPLVVADQQILGFLKLSPSVLGSESVRERVFALKAIGNSMNRAFIKGSAVNDGDYVLVDSELTEPQSGSYVVASYEGGANIKKYVRTPEGHVMLVSESSEEHPPIILSSKDDLDFRINGTVERVISMLPAIA